jgi:hypothetical protein
MPGHSMARMAPGISALSSHDLNNVETRLCH